jgi:glycine/D-amino acid oxidase-like deaminating enzyme
MARIVVVGAGVVALGAAMLLARDGHQVIVLERDPETIRRRSMPQPSKTSSRGTG